MKNTLIIAFILIFASTSWAGEMPTGYYSDASGKTGKDLLVALSGIVSSHEDHGYDALKNGYKDTDKKPNGNVWDIYSDVPGGTPPYEFQFGNTCGTYQSEGDCYNREHTFPQSWFDKSSPMRNDIIHVLPTDGKVNGMRSNYPYGEVSNPSKTSLNGCKVGSNTTAGYSGTVFEPLDEYKGDLARIYFYMAACYNSKIAGWQNNGTADAVLAGNNYPVYDDWQLALLLKWHTQDPVSDKEIARNNACYDYQDNRNPFVDYPDFVCAIWSNGDCGDIVIDPGTPTVVDSTADVTINMSTSDYQIIVDYVNANLTNTDDHPDNTENYYGASAFHSNFDIRADAYSSTFSGADAAISEAIVDVFLPAKVDASLLNVDYIVNYATYDGSASGSGSKTYHCSAVSPLAFTSGAATVDPIDTTPNDTSGTVTPGDTTVTTPEDTAVVNPGGAVFELSMVASDYTLIIDYVKANGLPNTSEYDDSEYYYGSSSFHSNFDIRDGKQNASFSSPEAAIEEAIIKVILPAKASDAKVNDNFKVNYATYDGSATTAAMVFYCSSTDPLTFVVGQVTSLVQNEERSSVSLYPNPTSSSFALSVDASSVEVLSLSGQVLMMRSNVAAKEELDLSDFEQGLYLVRIHEHEKTHLLKLVKE